MPATHTVTFSWSNGTSQGLNGEITKSGGNEHNIVGESIPDGSTDLEVIWTCDVSALLLLYMLADQDLTIKTNSSGSPDATINLKKDEAETFFEGGANPLGSTDVTSIFVTNASGTDATLDIRSLVDPTP